MNASALRFKDVSALAPRRRSSFFQKLHALAMRLILWPARVLATRRTLAELGGLSEYELRDVGLTRQDLMNLTARPLDEDPTPHLVAARISRAHRVV
jgi:uncharacterized protein YjiS (DUF1127 family)